jgi:hypothetical protein
MASQLPDAWLVRLVGWAAMAVAMTGCVTVYQPLVGLQRPIAVDPQSPTNFANTRVLLRCHPSDAVWPDELCRNLRSSLSKQGATVTTEVVRPSPRAAPAAPSETPAQFIIDITSKLIHASGDTILSLLNIVSFTIVPAVTEETFGQEISIRDGQGFILAQQSFQERFVKSFGIGVWALNGLIDLLIRPKSEQVTGDGYKQDFTRDLHGHLAQLLYNAKVRARVMKSFAPEASTEKPIGTAP